LPEAIISARMTRPRDAGETRPGARVILDPLRLAGPALGDPPATPPRIRVVLPNSPAGAGGTHLRVDAPFTITRVNITKLDFKDVRNPITRAVIRDAIVGKDLPTIRGTVADLEDNKDIWDMLNGKVDFLTGSSTFPPDRFDFDLAARRVWAYDKPHPFRLIFNRFEFKWGDTTVFITGVVDLEASYLGYTPMKRN
jgi:hypothetical protein